MCLKDCSNLFYLSINSLLPRLFYVFSLIGLLAEEIEENMMDVQDQIEVTKEQLFADVEDLKVLLKYVQSDELCQYPFEDKHNTLASCIFVPFVLDLEFTCWGP